MCVGMLQDRKEEVRRVMAAWLELELASYEAALKSRLGADSVDYAREIIEGVRRGAEARTDAPQRVAA